MDKRNVAPPLTRRREENVGSIQPEVVIMPEPLLYHFLRQPPVCGSDELRRMRSGTEELIVNLGSRRPSCRACRRITMLQCLR
jgi:hypothetical protein